MTKNIFERVRSLFEDLSKSPKTQKELSRFNQIIQFRIINEEPFFVRISDGGVTAERGEVEQFDFMDVLLVKTDTDAISALLERNLTLGEALFQGKIYIYGSIGKEYIIAWLSKMLRIR